MLGDRIGDVTRTHPCGLRPGSAFGEERVEPPGEFRLRRGAYRLHDHVPAIDLHGKRRADSPPKAVAHCLGYHDLPSAGHLGCHHLRHSHNLICKIQALYHIARVEGISFTAWKLH